MASPSSGCRKIFVNFCPQSSNPLQGLAHPWKYPEKKMTRHDLMSYRVMVIAICGQSGMDRGRSDDTSSRWIEDWLTAEEMDPSEPSKGSQATSQHPSLGSGLGRTRDALRAF